MQRLNCIISYDGSAFSGYQIQPNQRTVQAEIENVLKKMHKGLDVKVFASGRTDASVHAVGQSIHFDTPLNIPINKWKIALNSLLPEEISVIQVQRVSSDFHARFNVKTKEYRYKVSLSKDRDVFMRHYHFHYPYQLDYIAIKEAIKYLVGTHDFTSFCSAKTEVEDKIRTIYEIEFSENDDLLTFRFIGNGFLYNMVRIMVGTLLEVGQGYRKPEEIVTILEQQDRTKAGKTAPGNGLYLWKVHYDN
ncbi:tRNA pseudouridine38-40 synthase [Bacillus mesophilus]|uniref:tRNA pseudouridine synthase A n=1 Tax=Bacillus mesophilus TaxID=1808955 RepID=A0A6M0QC73_9BACI|nr:tRNA pseudouridine(38-40) synthase TruA [Bacillus mesophilus]MBM7663330.1 tRNA pseudouridine38-40 synthase [Bacillus mesophilus]NEY73981.1 tRNA pseudouridine(38-40) synthase TruA [Bacillus mesophilus]